MKLSPSPRRAFPSLAALTTAILVSASLPVLAQSPGTLTGDRASDMAADLLVARPLGIVGIAIGATLFVVSLPFTLPTGSAGDAAHELVAKPFEYTFDRPLGEFQRCGDDRHPCGGGGRP